MSKEEEQALLADAAPPPAPLPAVATVAVVTVEPRLEGRESDLRSASECLLRTEGSDQSMERERKRKRQKGRDRDLHSDAPSAADSAEESVRLSLPGSRRSGATSLNALLEGGSSPSCRDYQEQAEALARIAHEFNIDRDEVLAKAWEVGSVVSSLQSSERDADFSGDGDVAVALGKSPTPPQRGASPFAHLISTQEMSDQRSAGVFSARSSGGGSTVTVKSKRSAGVREERRRRKKVEFTRNYVEKVLVYEADNAIMIDIQYKRNRLGWLLLFLALAADVGLAAFALWVSLLRGLQPDLRTSVPTYSLLFWASIWQLPLYALLLVVLAMSDLFKLRDFTQLADRSVLLLTTGLGATFTLTTVLQSLAASYETSTMRIPPQYLPVVNTCIWLVLLARRWSGQRIFPQEVAAGLVAFLGYGITVVPNYLAYSTAKYAGQFYGLQAFLLVVAVVFTLWFLAVERCTAVSPSIVITIIPSIVLQVLGTLIAAVAWISANRAEGVSLANAVAHDNLFAMFQVDSLGYGVCAAVLLFLTQLLYLGAARYLDIMSLAAAVAMKTTVIPYFLYYVTCEDQSAPPQFSFVRALWANPNDDGNPPGTCPAVLWSPFLWAGTPIVVLGCVCIVVFASVKRQFVQRRIIASGRKKPIDAHNRHGKEKLSLPVDERGMPIKPRKRASALDG